MFVGGPEWHLSICLGQLLTEWNGPEWSPTSVKDKAPQEEDMYKLRKLLSNDKLNTGYKKHGFLFYIKLTKRFFCSYIKFLLLYRKRLIIFFTINTCKTRSFYELYFVNGSIWLSLPAIRCKWVIRIHSAKHDELPPY